MSDKAENKVKKKPQEEKGQNPQIELEPQLREALTPMQRRHKAIVMKRHAPKIAAARRRAAKRIASADKLKGRSRKHAINQMRSKVAGQKGSNYKSLSASEKTMIDKKVKQKGAVVNRIAARLLPKLKRAEQGKFSKKKSVKESFEKTPRKRFHELYTKDGKVKSDKRFKINRKSVQAEEVADVASIYDLVINEALATPAQRERAMANMKSSQKERFMKAAMDNLHKRIAADKSNRKSVDGHALDVSREMSGVNSRELAALHRKLHEEHGAGEDGTTELKKTYVKDTPGQVDPDPSKSVNEAFEAFMTGPKDVNKLFEELLAEEKVSRKQMKAFERFVDRLFQKYDIDFEFTKHFGDRMGDERNDPDIVMQELADFVKKVLASKGKNIKAAVGDEAVLKDLQADLNMPVVIKYDHKNDEFDVIAKTIMRKKNFKTPNKVINYA